MSTASSLKSEGNAHFAAKRWADAAASYTDAIRLEKDDTALSALLSNRSATYLHLGQPDKGTLAVRIYHFCFFLLPSQIIAS